MLGFYHPNFVSVQGSSITVMHWARDPVQMVLDNHRCSNLQEGGARGTAAPFVILAPSLVKDQDTVIEQSITLVSFQCPQPKITCYAYDNSLYGTIKNFCTNEQYMVGYNIGIYIPLSHLTSKGREEHKCHIALLSVLRNAITRNGGSIYNIYSPHQGVYIVYTTSISRYWIPGIPACLSIPGNVALACNHKHSFYPQKSEMLFWGDF